MGYYQGVKALTKALQPKGCRRYIELQSQPRFEFQNRFGKKVQLVYCRAEKTPNGFRVHPRGPLTIQFVNPDQLELALDDQSQIDALRALAQEADSENYWLLVELINPKGKQPWFKVHLARIESISRGKTRLSVKANDWRVLYDGSLFDILPKVDDKPMPVSVEVNVIEKEDQLE
jgi:hypothetical protein